MAFLSIQAQDFIEETARTSLSASWTREFLSIQAQDFIEERTSPWTSTRCADS